MASLKARDIIQKLDGKYDPQLINILCAMVERDEVNHRGIIQVAEAYDRLVNMFTRVIHGTKGMENNTQKLMARLGLGESVSKQVESLSESDDSTDATVNMNKKD